MRRLRDMEQADLRRWFDYDRATGLLTWKARPPRSRREVGSVAGTIVTSQGIKRRQIWLKGERMYAARAAFIWMHGPIPEGALVDHIDGDTLNDAADNLRLAGEAQNTWNRVRRGKYAPGVSKDARGRFKARIQIPTGRKVNLGTWATEEEAHAAYMGAAAMLHSDFWVGNRPAYQQSAVEAMEGR